MNRHRRRHIPSRLIIIALFLMFGMGIGYAAISTTLTIDGTSDIDSASWNVHFENVQVTSGSVTATTPSITDDTTVSFTANLANPGNFYEFTVDVLNEGTLDAKLDGITILPELTDAQKAFFRYSVTYENGMDISTGDALNVGATEKILIRCEYLNQTDTSLYPTEDTNFTFSVSMTYVQGHGNAKSVVYDSDANFTIGETIEPSNYYSTFQEAINNSSTGLAVFKYLVSGKTIKASYLCLADNLCLRSGGAIYNSGNTIIYSNPFYENNKALLSGDSTCTENTTQGDFTCGSSGNYPIIKITKSGNVTVEDAYDRLGIESGASFHEHTLG